MSESQGSRVYKCSDTLLTAGGDPAKPPLIGPLGSDLSATCSSSIRCRHSGLGVYARWGSAVQERAGGYRGRWEREKPPSEHQKQHWVLKQWCWEFSFPPEGGPGCPLSRSHPGGLGAQGGTRGGVLRPCHLCGPKRSGHPACPCGSPQTKASRPGPWPCRTSGLFLQADSLWAGGWVGGPGRTWENRVHLPVVLLWTKDRIIH